VITTTWFSTNYAQNLSKPSCKARASLWLLTHIHAPRALNKVEEKQMKRTLKHIGYAMGNFANTIAYQVLGNRIQFYYVDILGLNAATAGILC
jgi:hypothetical protein